MPSEIEFLDDSGEPDGQVGEQLEPEPRRRLPRWAVAAGVLVLAGAATLAITTNDDGHSPIAATTAPHTASAPPSDTGSPKATRPLPGLDSEFATAVNLALPHSGAIQSATVVDGDLAVLAPGYLARVGYRSGRLHVEVGSDVGLPLGDPHYAQWELVTDGHDLWAVTERSYNGGRVTRLAPSTMRRSESTVAVPPAPIVGAAALDGHLYLNTEDGIYDIAPGAHSAKRAARGADAMVADPTRNRLLLLRQGETTAVSSLAPASNDAVSRALPFKARSLIVVNGAVWAAGTTDDAALRPVIAHLDPITLKVIGHSEVGAELTDSASWPTFTAGKSDFWVNSTHELWCVNATTGAVAQHWPSLYGIPVIRAAGQAFIAGGSMVKQLRLNHACAG